MACLGIRYGGIGDCVIRKECCGGDLHERSGLSGINHLRTLSNPNLAVKLPNLRVSTAVNAALAFDYSRRSDFSLFHDGLELQTEKNGSADDYEYNDRTSIESPTVSEKLDEWMRNSVTEIVKNIKQAPLLVQIYANGEVMTEKSPANNDWQNVGKNKSSSLVGLILVEELRTNFDTVDSGDKFVEDDGTRDFGVLIQGKVKGRDQCKSTCYLLKTSSVNGRGLGHICTHFCLMKGSEFSSNVLKRWTELMVGVERMFRVNEPTNL